MVIGHQKGRDTKEKIHRNFGMPRPEGYRKALRLMKLAEKFGMPVFTFVDTPGRLSRHRRRGARPVRGDRPQPLRHGRTQGADHRTVIGEGGSGGALAIAVGRHADDAAVRHVFGDLARRLRVHPVEERRQGARSRRDMGITASRLKTLGLIDRIVSEPLGGAHRDHRAAAQSLKRALQDALRQCADLSPGDLVEKRFDRLMGYGKFKEQQVA
jgi:acetyl-CoA carboxylase carboxyl transferase subunit alpha